jgi:CBS-domain-containing membrane protein
LRLQDEFALALLPTLTILAVLGIFEAMGHQRVLFASLASSAFLIYLDPFHAANGVRTLVTAQLWAATLGLITYLVLGPGYSSAGGAMLLTILLMILLNAVHPPAVGTSLIFAFRAGDESNLLIFGLAVAMTAILVLLEQWALWALVRYTKRTNPDKDKLLRR